MGLDQVGEGDPAAGFQPEALGYGLEGEKSMESQIMRTSWRKVGSVELELEGGAWSNSEGSFSWVLLVKTAMEVILVGSEIEGMNPSSIVLSWISLASQSLSWLKIIVTT